MAARPRSDSAAIPAAPDLAPRVIKLETVLAAVLVRLDQLEARHAEQEALIRALRRQEPRDAEDARLLEVLPTLTKGLPFKVSWLLEHARVDPALAAALADAGLQTVDEIGAWLRDRRGVSAGIAVMRCRRRWQVTRSTR